MKQTEFKCLNPDFKADIEEKLTRQFFMKLMGFDLCSIELGEVKGELTIGEQHLQQNYIVHGGVMATAADIVMGFAAYTLLPKNFGVVTVDLNISYQNPGLGEKLHAVGKVTKAGRQVFFCEADIFVENKGERILTNKATATMYRIDSTVVGKN